MLSQGKGTRCYSCKHGLKLTLLKPIFFFFFSFLPFFALFDPSKKSCLHYFDVEPIFYNFTEYTCDKSTSKWLCDPRRMRCNEWADPVRIFKFIQFHKIILRLPS